MLAVAEESFSHLSDHRRAAGQAPHIDTDDASSPLGRFAVETLPAGTRLQTWVRLTNATAAQVAYTRDVLARFAAHGHLGGRIAAGHGQISAVITPTVLRGALPDNNDSGGCCGWAQQLAADRDAALTALQDLT